VARTILFLAVSAILALAIVAGIRYEGHWLAYLLFTLLLNGLLFNGFRQKAIYFDTFIGIFLWLGFWLKFSLRVAFTSGLFHEPVGSFDGSAQAFDHALTVSSVGIAALLLASIVRQCFFAYPDESPTCVQSGLFMFYRAYRKFFVAGFLLLVVLVAASNAVLGIYQRGMVAQTILPYGMNGLYKWLLQFGLASVAALIIRFEIELNRNLSLMAIFPPLLESFFSNLSLLSRGMILNSAALGIGGLRLIRAMEVRVNPFVLFIATITFIALFASSVFAVNYLRAASLESESSTTIAAAQNMTTPLFIDRWVGIEGVMAVSSSGMLGWNLWQRAWQEKYREGHLSIYDESFIDSPYKNPAIDKSKHHFVSLPGIVAFLYYPGSLSFLFACMFACGLLAAILELAAYRLGGKNFVLCSLFAQVIAYRFLSFGYVPGQSYLLFGTLALNILVICAADYVLRRFFSNRWRVV
jgi:hypothetical protein